MTTIRWILPALALALALVTTGCDRNLEPFDPDEQPATPDLGRIFPEGARRAAETPPAMPEAPTPPGAARGTASSDEAQPFEGTVRLGPGLSGPAGGTLFIVARHGPGGPPLAVRRVPSPSFPLPFSIGPDDRMMKGMPFTGPIQVTARLDADGNATSRTPGDLEGAAAKPVQPGDTGVEIILDQVL